MRILRRMRVMSELQRNCLRSYKNALRCSVGCLVPEAKCRCTWFLSMTMSLCRTDHCGWLSFSPCAPGVMSLMSRTRRTGRRVRWLNIVDIWPRFVG